MTYDSRLCMLRLRVCLMTEIKCYRSIRIRLYNTSINSTKPDKTRSTKADNIGLKKYNFSKLF